MQRKLSTACVGFLIEPVKVEKACLELCVLETKNLEATLVPPETSALKSGALFDLKLCAPRSRAGIIQKN